jgi:hypothetical protein
MDDKDLGKFFEKRMAMAESARTSLEFGAPSPSHLLRIAEDFLEMIDAYISDARHFADEGDIPRAIEAVSYAYGWIDSGVRVGLFDVSGDDVRFTLSE